jgi:glycerol uptake facilitator-like aquaporin
MNPVQYAADTYLGFTSVWLRSEMVLLVLFGWFVWDSLSSHSRDGWALVLSEFVATFGLLSVIWGCSRLRSGAVPFAVASYITAAYWFTASTSFANPAVTIARSLV